MSRSRPPKCVRGRGCGVCGDYPRNNKPQIDWKKEIAAGDIKPDVEDTPCSNYLDCEVCGPPNLDPRDPADWKIIWEEVEWILWGPDE